MARFKALRNLTIGDGSGVDKDGKHIHRSFKKGEVFECSDEFADEHLHPHGHVEETSEPVTVKAKAEARKAAKATKVEEPKKEDKGGKK